MQCDYAVTKLFCINSSIFLFRLLRSKDVGSSCHVCRYKGRSLKNNQKLVMHCPTQKYQQRTSYQQRLIISHVHTIYRCKRKDRFISLHWCWSLRGIKDLCPHCCCLLLAFQPPHHLYQPHFSVPASWSNKNQGIIWLRILFLVMLYSNSKAE